MKHIVTLSGGKDSTAMLLRMLELKMPIDEIHHFDVGNWDYPQVQRHINKLEKVIGIPIKRIKPERPFDYYFTEYIRTRGEKKGVKGYGFPGIRYRWCTRIKSYTLDHAVPKHGILKYIGIDRKEMKRSKSKILEKQYVKFPLIDWGWGGIKALRYCYSRGFYWEGLYNYFSRTGCWCCPFQSITELRTLRRYFPDLWQRLKEMQKLSDRTFLTNKVSVFNLDKRFEDEEKHKFFKYKKKINGEEK